MEHPSGAKPSSRNQDLTQHHCSLNFMACTKLAQAAGTANPSSILPSATSAGNCQQLFPKQAGSFFPLVSFCQSALPQMTQQCC